MLSLKDQRRLFGLIPGRVGGIVSHTGLPKPAVRMWLFGMVKRIEMRFSRLIEHYCRDEKWRQYLSKGVFRIAEALPEERIRRHPNLS